MRRLERPLRVKSVRAALVISCLVAGLSSGGGFVAGVLLAPLLVLVARRASRWAAWGYGLLAGTLAAEVGWGAAYLLVGEQEPTIWLVPVTVGLAVLGAAVVEHDVPRNDGRI